MHECVELLLSLSGLKLPTQTAERSSNVKFGSRIKLITDLPAKIVQRPIVFTDRRLRTAEYKGGIEVTDIGRWQGSSRKNDLHPPIVRERLTHHLANGLGRRLPVKFPAVSPAVVACRLPHESLEIAAAVPPSRRENPRCVLRIKPICLLKDGRFAHPHL
jgi:hypothetical protein